MENNISIFKLSKTRNLCKRCC